MPSEEKPIKKNTKEIKEKSSYYISPKQFTLDLREYYDLSDEMEKFPEDGDPKEKKILSVKLEKSLNKCGEALLKIVKGLANNGKFSGYTWREEMITDALIKMTKALVGKKYKFETGYNPFSYFNRIGWHEFVKRIRDEKKHIDTINRYKSEHYKDFAMESDVPIYVKQSHLDNLTELWDENNVCTIKSQLEED